MISDRPYRTKNIFDEIGTRVPACVRAVGREHGPTSPHSYAETDASLRAGRAFRDRGLTVKGL